MPDADLVRSPRLPPGLHLTETHQPMIPPAIPDSPGLVDDQATASDRVELASRLIAVVNRAVAIGRLAGDTDEAIRSVLRFALARAIDPQGPTLIRSGHLGRGPRHFPVAQIRRAIIRGGFGPSDVYGLETASAITCRAIDRATMGDRLAGPGVWPAEQEPRR
jgi:hypothetical protein